MLSEQTPGDARVLLVDDHPIVRHGVKHLLRALPGIQIVGEAGDADAAMEALRTLNPDIGVIDIGLPGVDGIRLVGQMLQERPELRVLVLSMYEDPARVLRAIYAGARGYLIKQESLDHLAAALESVRAGRLYLSPRLLGHRIFQLIQRDGHNVTDALRSLSPRELAVFELLGAGRAAPDIADRLDLSVKTVETHRTHIKDKLHFDNSVALGKFAATWMAAKTMMDAASSGQPGVS
jgi:two-component system nitrate/nitrite response regulator NarL